VVLTREPGGSPVAETIRELLLSGRVAPFGPEAEALLFALARADHVEQVVRPALQSGKWVICDRFTDSTRAYQGSGGAGSAYLDRLDRIAVGDDRPDLTLILDLPPQVGLTRLSGRGQRLDRFEADAIELQERRRQVFLDIAAADPQRCAVIDASAGETQVTAVIAQVVAARLLATAADRGG
jgi:dTMP kinase